jgi:LPS export ABC transporter protein LptC
VLENQLLAQPLKGIIDFLRHPLGSGANEEPTTQSGGARRSQNQSKGFQTSKCSFTFMLTNLRLKTSINISLAISKSAALLLLVTFLLSCERKMDIIKKSDILFLPTQTVKNFETVYTDSAKLQLVLSSSLMERYSNSKPPYSEFKNGIKVIFYDGHKDPVAAFTSKYARFLEDKRLWELKDSVVAVNEKNERLETELLYWDQEKDLVYTDRAVRITNENEIVVGIGLESNIRFTNWKIKDVSATIAI